MLYVALKRCHVAAQCAVDAVRGDEYSTFEFEALAQRALPQVHGVGVNNRCETVIENDLLQFHEIILTKVQISKCVCRRSVNFRFAAALLLRWVTTLRFPVPHREHGRGDGDWAHGSIRAAQAVVIHGPIGVARESYEQVVTAVILRTDLRLE